MKLAMSPAIPGRWIEHADGQIGQATVILQKSPSI
jgi:hypothetical protein